MLFDDFQRSNISPLQDGELLYTFLNRAAGDYWQSVRDVLTAWLANYPAAEQPTLIARFRRTDRRGFLGAFWELYLHELFTRLGFQIELHPKVSGTTHRPDFHLRQGAAEIFVEAVTHFEPQAHSLDDVRLTPVLDAIDRISSPSFRVSLDARQIALAPIPMKRLSQEIESWLEGLESASESNSVRSAERVYRWQEDGWMLIFRPIPREAVANGRTASDDSKNGPARTKVRDDSRAIRQRVSGKARIYGRRFDKPFLIALTSYRPNYGPETVLRGLFGSAWRDPEMLRARVVPRARGTNSNGLWLSNSGLEYQDVSAVLTAFELMPWSIARSRPWLVANPWASHPLGNVLPFDRFGIDATTGAIEQVETSFKPRIHFGLARNWPSAS